MKLDSSIVLTWAPTDKILGEVKIKKFTYKYKYAIFFELQVYNIFLYCRRGQVPYLTLPPIGDHEYVDMTGLYVIFDFALQSRVYCESNTKISMINMCKHILGNRNYYKPTYVVLYTNDHRYALNAAAAAVKGFCTIIGFGQKGWRGDTSSCGIIFDDRWFAAFFFHTIL